MNKNDRIISVTYYVFCFILILLGIGFLCEINQFIAIIVGGILTYLYLAFTSIPYEQKHKTVIDDIREQTTLLILHISYEDYMKLPLEEKTKIQNSLQK